MHGLREKIAQRDFTVAVVGIGRVGLPLAISFADAGLKVIGLDRDSQHVERVNAGHFPFVEHGAKELLQRSLSAGRFRATTDPAAAISEAQVVILTVGTPLGQDLRPDNSQIESAVGVVSDYLPDGSLVVLRSTVSAGTTNRVVLPALTRQTGYRLGESLFVAFCPERIAEGKAIEELRVLPEIVGGCDRQSAELTGELFRLLNPEKKTHLTDALSAELAKLFTNVYRYVNFALANEYALIAEHYGRDAGQIISMLRDDYQRAPVPLPGPAGGPCLTKDGYFLIEELNFPDFVLTAWKLNDSIPAHIVKRVQRYMEARGTTLEGKKVAVLGRAFKADIDDDRLSPSLRLIDALQRLGADVHVHDPYLPSETLEAVLEDAEVIVLATNHKAYSELDPKETSRLASLDCLVADCWAMLDERAWRDAGFGLIALGRG